MTPLGIVFGVNANNDLFVRVGVTKEKGIGVSWLHLVAPKFKHISVGRHAYWAVNSMDVIYYYNGMFAYRMHVFPTCF